MTAAIVVLTVLVPLAEFFALRLLVRSQTVIHSLGMPWPGPISDVVQAASLAEILTTVVLGVVGITRRGSARAAGIVAIVVTLASVVPVFVAMLMLTFGDSA